MAPAIATEIFLELDRIGHRLAYSFLSEAELARIPDKTMSQIIYDVYKERAIAFFSHREKLNFWREWSIEKAKSLKIVSPITTAECAMIFNQTGECAELSTFTMVKASLVFKGTVCLVTVSDSSLNESHCFNVLFDRDEQAIAFKDFLISKAKFTPKDLLLFPDAYVMDAYFRKSFIATEVMAQREFSGYFERNKITEVHGINVKKHDKAGEVVLAQAASLAEVLKTVSVPKSPLLRALELHREEDRIEEENKAMIRSRFTDLEWSDSGRLLLAKGSDLALRTMESSIKTTFGVFQGVFDNGQRFALVCAAP
jgi:hypothetical protein